VPPDWDKDRISNVSDPNDDNDGLSDTVDPFAIDRRNGTTRFLPLRFTWNTSAPPVGGLEGLGFTGLMTNGVSNYASLFDGAKMTAGGAAGVTTVEEVTSGDAWQALDNQEYAFQVGARVPTGTAFTAHTRIVAPFNGFSPQNEQSMGLFVGNGNQDNYAKIVTAANGGSGGLQYVREIGGVTDPGVRANAVSLADADFVDVYLTINPQAATIKPTYSITGNGVTGPRVSLLGTPGTETIPVGWYAHPKRGLAVGIISTSRNASPFPASWDFIETLTGNGTAPPTLAPLARSQPRRSFTVRWSVPVTVPGPRVTVQVKSAPIGGSYGAYRTWKADTALRSATFTGAFGRSYCFRARTKSGDGTLSPWSATRCTKIPRP
jgi:hypothetical protein